MTTKRPHFAPLQVNVANSQTVEDVLTRTKGLLKLIETACNAAKDTEDTEQIFSADLVASLAMMCYFADQDLVAMETYLSADAADFHKWQLDNMALEAPPAPQE